MEPCVVGGMVRKHSGADGSNKVAGCKSEGCQEWKKEKVHQCRNNDNRHPCRFSFIQVRVIQGQISVDWTVSREKKLSIRHRNLSLDNDNRQFIANFKLLMEASFFLPVKRRLASGALDLNGFNWPAKSLEDRWII